MHRLPFPLLILFAAATLLAAAEAPMLPAQTPPPKLTPAQQAAVADVFAHVKAAGQSYSAGQYEQCGQQIEAAMQGVAELTGDQDPTAYQAVAPVLSVIARAHALLELEGVRLPPFKRPAPPTSASAKSAEATAPAAEASPSPKPNVRPTPTPANPAPNTPAAPGTAPSAGGISFARQVAPILVNHCGQCHIKGAKGGVSMASFAALMKGPPEGVVIFAGDTVGSRLVETIETGDMPRGGGKVPADQLKIIKDWIAAGAAFDGPSPTVPLLQYAGSTAGPGSMASAGPQQPLTVQRPRGNETVSFSADIAPLLVANCNGCHIDAMQTRGGLRLDTFAQMLRGGDSGPLLRPGNGDGSLLVRKLRGQEGDIMPAGGRPKLPDQAIQLISTWINEGAVLDGGSDDQPLRTMASLAWANSASHEELLQRRREMAMENWKLGATAAEGAAPQQAETENFLVLGALSPATLQMVANAAEETLDEIRSIVRPPSKGPAIKGRATLFVLPKRYDYSEFSRMVEQRSIPSDWNEHWRYDGVDAYLPLVVASEDDEEQVRLRLIAPLTSLALATRGSGDVPRWMAEGIGRAASAKLGGRKNTQADAWKRALPDALAAMTKPDDLLAGRLTAEQADLVAFLLGTRLIDRSVRRQLDFLLAALDKGQPFDAAFVAAYRGKPQDLVNLVLQVRPAGNAQGRRGGPR